MPSELAKLQGRSFTTLSCKAPAIPPKFSFAQGFGNFSGVSGMVRLLVAIALMVLAGCGQTRIEATDADSLKSEIERIAGALGKDKATEFKTAADVLLAHALMSAPEPKERESFAIAALNGKTSDEIIAAYKGLGPQLQMELGRGLADARDAAWQMKEDNDYKQRALDAMLALEKHPRYSDKGFPLIQAIQKVNRIYDEQGKSAKWFAEQLEKSPEQIIREFGPDSSTVPK